MPEPTTSEFDCIKEVWNVNLEEEFRKIRLIVQNYPYVAMDTEFPGIVCQPLGDYRSTFDYQYQGLRANVDALNVIQIGLTFMDSQGNFPSPVTTWQFNFKFNLEVDLFAQISIDLLTNCGIQFDRHKKEGIDYAQFAELLISSGVILQEQVTWVAFHSAFDFAYLLKMLTNEPLPVEEVDFLALVKMWFCNIYDIKFIMKSCMSLKGGLQELAEQLEIPRIGPQHQAGSDSLLTGATFFRIKQLYFGDKPIDEGYNCQLFGVNTTYDALTVHPITPINSYTPLVLPPGGTPAGATAGPSPAPTGASTTSANSS